MPNYQNAKIYKIVAPDDSKYIGSTTQELKNRLAAHKTKYRYWKDGTYKYEITSFKLFEKHGVENCKIELLEDYPCSSKKELETREGYLILQLECVNKVIAGRDKSEWRSEHSDDLKQYWRAYYADNLERYKERNKRSYHENIEKSRERSKKYREANKDQINERRRIKYQQRKLNKNQTQ